MERLAANPSPPHRLHLDLLDLDEAEIAPVVSGQLEESRSESHMLSQKSLLSETESSQIGGRRETRLNSGWAWRDRLAADL
jgi:hypothetical protein